jgi:hypothetical protein
MMQILDPSCNIHKLNKFSHNSLCDLITLRAAVSAQNLRHLSATSGIKIIGIPTASVTVGNKAIEGGIL